MFKAVIRSTVIVVFFLLADQASFGEDIILKKSTNKPMKVDKVTLETYEEVRYKKGSGSEQKLTADKVYKVEYGDTPDAYIQGMNLLRNYDYENAVSSFRLAMEDGRVRDWIKTYALYHIGKAYQAWGNSTPSKYGDAIKAYKDLLTANPKTRFYADVLMNLAICYSQSGDIQNAVTTLDRLAKEAYEKKLGIIWEANAKHQKANIELEGGLLDDAERDFRSSENFCREQAGKCEDPPVKSYLEKLASLAKLSQGTILIKRKKYSQAKNFFNEIVNNSASIPEAIASAQNGLGECLLTEKKLKEAQIQFVTTKVVYGGIVEEAARATYFLGVCCLEMKDLEPRYKKKAHDYFREVVDLYPKTRWAKEARKKLK